MPQNPSSELSALQLVDIRQLPWVRPLAIDYAYDFSGLTGFFAGNPASRDDWATAVARARTHTRDRARLVDALREQQGGRDSPAASRASAERLLDPSSVAIVTGQQAGLFGGPLYTLLKALTALRLAERVEAEHGVPAVPVFWIDAEDHDWDEVASCAVLDGQDALRVISLPRLPGAGEGPVADVELTAQVAGALDALKTALPPTAFTDELLASLGQAYRPGVGMVRAFGRWLDQVLGGRGLVVYDSSDPATKPLCATVFATELEHPGVTSRLAGDAGAALAAAGYHAQVSASPEGIALFHLGGGRTPIRRQGSAFAIGERLVEPAALVDEARSHPERFSPNVLLRPIVQDTLFPTACYVAGPSELAYLGQLRQVYAHFGLPMPLVHPRTTATVVDAAALRFLTRYEVPLGSLRPQDESALNRLLEAQLPPSVEASLVETVEALRERMSVVIAAVPAIDPTLAGAARSTLGKLEHDLQTLHSKIISAAKRRNETLRRQFTRTRALTFPDGHPQERVLGFVHFLNQYGPALVDELHHDLPLDLGTHAILSL